MQVDVHISRKKPLELNIKVTMYYVERCKEKHILPWGHEVAGQISIQSFGNSNSFFS